MGLIVYTVAPKVGNILLSHKEGIMQLSKVGVLTNLLWSEVVTRIPNLELGEFIVMPHHVHGVLVLDNSDLIGALHDNTK
jgi:hypothetical protein